MSHDQRILCTLPEEGVFSEEAGEDLNASSIGFAVLWKNKDASVVTIENYLCSTATFKI